MTQNQWGNLNKDFIKAVRGGGRRFMKVFHKIPVFFEGWLPLVLLLPSLCQTWWGSGWNAFRSTLWTAIWYCSIYSDLQLAGTSDESGRRFNVDAVYAGRKCQLRHLCGFLQIKICAVCMKGSVEQIWMRSHCSEQILQIFYHCFPTTRVEWGREQ